MNTTDPNGAKIELATSTAIYGQLARCANWLRVDDRGQVKATKPPKELAPDFCEFPSQNLPEIEMVTFSPTFAKDGEAIITPGYHLKEKLFYSPPAKFCIPSILKTPTQQEIINARKLITDELLGDFPFTGEPELAHAVAAMMLPFVIKLIDSPTPLHFIEASERGSGKTLLSKSISLVATGEDVEARTFPGNEEEIRKVITAELTKGRPVILLDNISGTLVSDSLAAVLTSTKWTDRILGETRTISLPNRVLWLATGNNASLGADFTRRVLRIRLDPNMEKPWERTEFKHTNLIHWIRDNREKLVQAVMTLVQAWLVAGRPAGKKTLGSFESWASVIGGILETVGISGFLGNLQEVYEISNAEDAPWRELVTAWYAKFTDKPVRISALNTFCEEHSLLTSIRGSKNDRSQQSRLGRALKRNRDRIFAGYKIIQCNSTGVDGHGRTTYSVVPIGKNTPTPTKPDSPSPDFPRLHDLKYDENHSLFSTTYHTRHTSPYFFDTANNKKKGHQNNSNILRLEKSMAKYGEEIQNPPISIENNDLTLPYTYVKPSARSMAKYDILGEKSGEKSSETIEAQNIDASPLGEIPSTLNNNLPPSALKEILNLSSDFCECGTKYQISQDGELVEAVCPTCGHSITVLCDSG